MKYNIKYAGTMHEIRMPLCEWCREGHGENSHSALVFPALRKAAREFFHGGNAWPADPHKWSTHDEEERCASCHLADPNTTDIRLTGVLFAEYRDDMCPTREDEDA